MKKTLSFLTILLVFLLTSSLRAGDVDKYIYYEKKTNLYYPKKYTFRFSLWNDPTSTDPASMVWSEEKEITLTTAKIRTYLGDTTSFYNDPDNPVNFGQQLYIQVERKKADGTYVVIGTRGKFSVVPYAMGMAYPVKTKISTTQEPLLYLQNSFGPAIVGESLGGGRGINGKSNTGRGVYGESVSNVGVYGTSQSGWGV